MFLLLSAAGCPGEKERLRQRVQRLEREKRAAEISVARWRAKSKAQDQYLDSVTRVLIEVGNRIDKIQEEQKGLIALSVQRNGDFLRIVKNKSLPQALDRLDEQLQKNREQIGQLESLLGTKSAQSEGLRAVVDRLKKQNEGLDHQLQSLRRTLGILSKKVKTLETTVVKLSTTVDEKVKIIEENERVIKENEDKLTQQNLQIEAAETERWTRSYIVGTRKELCDLAIIAPCGVFKSVRAPRLSDRYLDSFEACEEKCQTVDARSLQEIFLGKTRSGKEVLPQRPVSSYAFEVRNGESYLLIRNPEEFWKSRYLVVMVER